MAEARAQASESTIPQLLARYMEQRGEERADWTSKGKLKGTVSDFNKVQAAMEFLRQKEISTVETLDRQLDGISETAVAIRDSMRKAERRIKDIDTLLSHIGNYEKYKPVYKEYAAIGWKKQKEKFEEAHRGKLDAYRAAARYVKTHLSGTSYSRKELEAERKDLAAALPGKREELEAVQADVRTLRDVRHWLNQVLPDRRAGEKAIHSGGLERPGAAYPAGAGETAATAPDTETTGYGALTLTSGTRHFQFWNDGCLFHFKEAAIAFI